MSDGAAAAPYEATGNRSSVPVDLSEIVRRLQPLRVEEGRHGSVKIRRVLYDHRRVAPPDAGGPPGTVTGDLFCCVPGEHVDGHLFAQAAVDGGAVALLAERQIETVTSVPMLMTEKDGVRPAMAKAACVAAGDPAQRLKTVGITGTNGKTTTTWLLKSILEEHGWPTAVIGTLGGARTTPEAPDLQALFRDVADSGRQAVTLEVTSHALHQHRVDGYLHDVAVFTNLSQDHLDYHKTMESYFAAKAALFDREHSVAGVVNADDEHGRRLLEGTAEVPVTPFSLSDAEDLETSLHANKFRLHGCDVLLQLAGLPNVMNALAAGAAARTLGVSDEVVAAGLSAAAPVEGRFESVENALGVHVVVDYAHTPDGLRAALGVMRQQAGEGRVLVVFGAGGDRDREKRPRMGATAASLADMVVVTSDNPRHEDPLAIISQVVAGCGEDASILVRPDRREAIAEALAAAVPGDVVLVAGKGHEKTQQIGDDLLPFDDRAVVREIAAEMAEAK